MSDDGTNDDDARFAGFEAIPIEVTIRVGATKCRLGTLTELTRGEVIPLGRHIGEPFDLLSGPVLLGRAEPVAHASGIAVKLVEIPEHDDDAHGP